MKMPCLHAVIILVFFIYCASKLHVFQWNLDAQLLTSTMYCILTICKYQALKKRCVTKNVVCILLDIFCFRKAVFFYIRFWKPTFCGKGEIWNTLCLNSFIHMRSVQSNWWSATERILSLFYYSCNIIFFVDMLL